MGLLEDYDRRGAERTRPSMGARLISTDGYAVGACTVCNLSRTGALLRSAGGFYLTRGMGLLIDGEESVRCIEVAWTSNGHCGVRFIPAQAVSHQGSGDFMGRAGAFAGGFSIIN